MNEKKYYYNAEVVYRIEEFFNLKDDNARIHYELYTDIEADLGFPTKFYAGVILHSIAKEGHVLQCKIFETGFWQNVINNEGETITDKVNAWIAEKLEHYENEALKLGATKGKWISLR